MYNREKIVRIILIAVVLLLFILSVNFFEMSNKLKERIELDKEFVMGMSTNYIAKDYIILIFNKENININELYEAIGYINATEAHARRFLGHEHEEILTYLDSTKKKIEKLIELIESKADNNAIDKQVNSIIQLQNNIIEMYPR